MLGGLFGRARKTFASRHEAFAAFVRAQFLPQYRWEIPEADFSEWTHAAGSEFQNVSQMWFLIYCAWLFRLASIHRYGYDFQRDVMAALRMRLAKHNAAEVGPLKDLPNLLELLRVHRACTAGSRGTENIFWHHLRSPGNEVEAALAIQMACTHSAAMSVLGRLGPAGGTEDRACRFCGRCCPTFAGVRRQGFRDGDVASLPDYGRP
jgi:hypothetical protein